MPDTNCPAGQRRAVDEPGAVAEANDARVKIGAL